MAESRKYDFLATPLGEDKYSDLSKPLLSEKEQKLNLIKEALQKSPSGLAEQGMKDISGGVMSGIQGFGKMLEMAPTPGNYINSKMKPIIQDLILGKGNKPEEFDPYKFMGTENKSFMTPGGALQLFGELLTAGNPIAKGAKIAEKPIMNLSEGVSNIFKSRKINPKDWVKMVQKGHDELLGESEKAYKFVSEQAKEKGINKINFSDDTKNMINDLYESGQIAKTKANKELIEKAKNGDYDALHKLQSDMGKRARKLESSEYAAENDVGEILSEKRDDLIDDIKNHFEKLGHPDIAKEWQKAREHYRKLKELYYPKHNNKISRMVHEDIREIPENPLNIFKKEMVPIEKLLLEHPEIKEQLGIKLKGQKFSDLLKKSAYGTILGGLAIEGIGKANHISDLLLNR